MNNRKLSELVATSETYAGGYVYSGVRISYGCPNISEGHLPPQLQNRVHFVKEYDRSPDQPRIAWNKRILAKLPIGSMVYFDWSTISGVGGETYQKVGQCEWSLWDEWVEERNS